jgi:branched-subunit amino acid transport protein AzlD
MTGSRVIIAILVMAAIICFTRLLPFLFFARRKPPALLSYLERSIPPLVMLLLVVYCLKDVRWASAPYGLPEIAGIALVVFLHLWRRNTLLSIAGGTVLYMIAIRMW